MLDLQQVWMFATLALIKVGSVMGVNHHGHGLL